MSEHHLVMRTKGKIENYPGCLASITCSDICTLSCNFMFSHLNSNEGDRVYNLNYHTYSVTKSDYIVNKKLQI